MEASLVIGASLAIGSTIFMYILALFAVLGFFAYLTYSISPKGKQRRADRREKRHNK